MNQYAIVNFLSLLGADVENRREGDKWINVKCPMAPYTHGGGLDSRPSFGVSINNEGQSVYYCFGCSTTAQNLGRLLHNMWLMTGEYPYEAAAFYAANEIFDDSSDAPIVISDAWKEEILPIVPLETQYITEFPLLQWSSSEEAGKCVGWLEEDRGVDRYIQYMCGVRYSMRDRAVIFPLTDIHGNTYVMRVRSRVEKSIWTVNPRFLNLGDDIIFPSLKRVGAWFGLHLIDLSVPIMCVEGEIDAMRLMSLGFLNAVASTGIVTEAQALAIHNPIIILGFDNDQGGEKACKRMIEPIGKKATILRADWSLAKNRKGGVCKDPGDLASKEELQVVLDNLVLV